MEKVTLGGLQSQPAAAEQEHEVVVHQHDLAKLGRLDAGRWSLVAGLQYLSLSIVISLSHYLISRVKIRCLKMIQVKTKSEAKQPIPVFVYFLCFEELSIYENCIEYADLELIL